MLLEQTSAFTNPGQLSYRSLFYAILVIVLSMILVPSSNKYHNLASPFWQSGRHGFSLRHIDHRQIHPTIITQGSRISRRVNSIVLASQVGNVFPL